MRSHRYKYLQGRNPFNKGCIKNGQDFFFKPPRNWANVFDAEPDAISVL